MESLPPEILVYLARFLVRSEPRSLKAFAGTSGLLRQIAEDPAVIGAAINAFPSDRLPNAPLHAMLLREDVRANPSYWAARLDREDILEHCEVQGITDWNQYLFGAVDGGRCDSIRRASICDADAWLAAMERAMSHTNDHVINTILARVGNKAINWARCAVRAAESGILENVKRCAAMGANLDLAAVAAARTEHKGVIEWFRARGLYELSLVYGTYTSGGRQLSYLDISETVGLTFAILAFAEDRADILDSIWDRYGSKLLRPGDSIGVYGAIRCLDLVCAKMGNKFPWEACLIAAIQYKRMNIIEVVLKHVNVSTKVVVDMFVYLSVDMLEDILSQIPKIDWRAVGRAISEHIANVDGKVFVKFLMMRGQFERK